MRGIDLALSFAKFRVKLELKDGLQKNESLSA